MLICTRTGRVLIPGHALRVLTRDGFTEGVLDSVALTGAVRVRSRSGVEEIRADEIEAVWRLS